MSNPLCLSAGAIPALPPFIFLDGKANISFAGEFANKLAMVFFAYLSASGLGKCLRVSKAWHKLASVLRNALELREIFPSLRFFDENDWRRVDLSSPLGLTVKDAPPLDKQAAIPKLMKCLSLPIRGNAGATLLTVPEGFTLNIVVKWVRSLHPAPAINLKFPPGFLERFGDIPVDKTYRVVITNDVLERGQREHLLAIGCEMPKVLELIMLVVVTCMDSNKWLYPSKSMHCFEKMDDCPLLVHCNDGSRRPAALNVYA